jgi:hypothetical protein
VFTVRSGITHTGEALYNALQSLNFLGDIGMIATFITIRVCFKPITRWLLFATTHKRTEGLA